MNRLRRGSARALEAASVPVTTKMRSPRYRIWIDGSPVSGTKRAKTLGRCRQRIASAASVTVPTPIKSGRIDLEIWFQSAVGRPDVDNILKPILDSLKGIVYVDDSQVRSVKVVALPHNDAYRLDGWIRGDTLDRLSKDEPVEFMIDVYEGLSLAGPGL